MKKSHFIPPREKRFLILCATLLFFAFAGRAGSGQAVVQYVDPFMGVNGKGNTVIGPQLPWGSANPSPDTEDGLTDGYNPLKKIRGFSQLHVTGTGGASKYGQFLISPQIGLNVRETGHDSGKAEERAQVASYQVRLTDYDILCEMAPARHAAIYRFTFPASDRAHVILDLGHSIPKDITRYNCGYADEGEVFVDPEKQLIKGWGDYWGGWSAEPVRVYFAAICSKRPEAFGTWKDQVVTNGVAYQKVNEKGQRIGAYFRFNTAGQEQIFFKIAVSLTSMEKAGRYLADEIPGWDFEKVRAGAETLWNEQLGKIRIEGATEDQKILFYSSLYQTMRMPRDRTGDNPHWSSAEPYWDDHYCVWDTWKTVFPLHVLLHESMVRDNVRAFIDRFKYNGQVLDAFIAGNDRYYEWRGDEIFGWLGNQGGDDVNNVIADAYVKGVRGVDWKAAYQLLKYSAEHERAPSYRAQERGWVPYRKYAFGMYCSRSLEFCYNDFCVAQMAKGLGFDQDYKKYLKRSHGWENLWNTRAASDGYTGFIAPRQLNGTWVSGYDPKQDRASASPGGIDRSFYEGSSWVYSYVVPHDFARLIQLSGGNQAYCEKLLHALKSDLIDFGNEPSFLTPFSFIYALRPDLSSYWVRKNTGNYSRAGFPGDEDSGAMGSWYVFAALGFFPSAGQDIYLLNGPMYRKATLTMENGKRIVVEGINASPENVYVQSLTLNGVPWNRAWLRHRDIKNGATLRFVMGPEPSDWGKTIAPPPAIDSLSH